MAFSAPSLSAVRGALLAITLGACTGSTSNHAQGGSGGGPTTSAFAATVMVNGAAMCPLGWDQSSVVASGSIITVEGGCGSDSFTLTYDPTPAPGGTAPATKCTFTTTGAAGSVTCPASGAVINANSTVSLAGTAPADLRVSGGCACATTTARPTTPCPPGQVPSNGTCVPAAADAGSDACPAGYVSDGGPCVGPCPSGYTLQEDACVGSVVASATYEALTLTVQ